MNLNKNTLRNSLSDQHLHDILTLAVSQMEPNIERLLKSKDRLPLISTSLIIFFLHSCFQSSIHGKKLRLWQWLLSVSVRGLQKSYIDKNQGRSSLSRKYLKHRVFHPKMVYWLHQTRNLKCKCRSSQHRTWINHNAFTQTINKHQNLFYCTLNHLHLPSTWNHQVQHGMWSFQGQFFRHLGHTWKWCHSHISLCQTYW